MNARKTLKVRGLFDIVERINGIYWLRQGTQVVKLLGPIELNRFQKVIQRILCCFGQHKFVYSGPDSNMYFKEEYEQRVLGGWCGSCHTAIQFKIQDICIPLEPVMFAKKTTRLIRKRRRERLCRNQSTQPR